MMRRLRLFLLAGALLVPTAATTQPASDEPSCRASPLVRDTAPRDPNADGVGPANWYINEDRSIWAGTVPADGWTAGELGNKTYWVRPAGTQLAISGRRVDAPAPPLRAHVPCCYPTGFQIVGLSFPTAGCWEVRATAGDRALTFVTRVEAAGKNGKK